MIPGRMLHRISAHICSAKSLERVIEPAIADLQREYLDASTRGGLSIGKLLANYLAVTWVMGVCTLEVSEAMYDERDNIRRTLLWACTATMASTILLTLPPLSVYPELRGVYAFLAVVPQALPLAIPVGLAFGLAMGVSGRATRSVTKAMLLTAFIASLLSFGTLAWLMPAGNQAFRGLAFEAESKRQVLPATSSRGPAELTFGELRREIDFAEATGQQQRARRYSWMFHLRFTLAAAVVAITMFMVAAPVKRRLFRALLAFAACVVYWALMYMSQHAILRGYLTPIVGAWLPNIAFVAVAVLIASSRSRQFRPAAQS